MLGIEAHIAVADVTVSGGDVSFLIKNHGFLAGHHEGEDEMESQNAGDNEKSMFFQEIHNYCFGCSTFVRKNFPRDTRSPSGELTSETFSIRPVLTGRHRARKTFKPLWKFFRRRRPT